MNRIKEVLEEKGIKQIWLAEKLGKSFNTVNSYVQNRQQPRLEVLDQIANNPNLSNYKVGVNLEAATKTALETGDNTIFAINDTEFIKYLETQNVIRIADLSNSARRALINNTIVLGDVKTTSQLTGTISTEGEDITATSGADVTLNGKVKVIRGNVYASNQSASISPVGYSAG